MAATALPHAHSTLRDAVDWHAYAAVHDLMAEHNPAYQALVDTYRAFLGSLRLSAGDVLLEVGAGTGNFALTAADVWPNCHVVHVDASDAMNARARDKRRALGLGNLEIRTRDVDAFELPANSVALATAIHSLYTFPDPHAVIARMFQWLRPGGVIFVCDPGHPVAVGEWTRYILRNTAAERGLMATGRLLWRARDVIRQNRRISREQGSGGYWRHDAESFRAAFDAAGFDITVTRTVYRGASDLLIAQKPLKLARVVVARDPYSAAV